MTTQTTAYAATAPNLSRLQAEVLGFLKSCGPHTREEIAGALGRKESSLCARLSELREMDLVVDDGTKRGVSGHFVTIYRATSQPEQGELWNL